MTYQTKLWYDLGVVSLKKLVAVAIVFLAASFISYALIVATLLVSLMLLIAEASKLLSSLLQ